MMNPDDEYENRRQIRNDWECAWKNCVISACFSTLEMAPIKVKCYEASFGIYKVNYYDFLSYERRELFICKKPGPSDTFRNDLERIENACKTDSIIKVILVKYGDRKFIFSIADDAVSASPSVEKQVQKRELEEESFIEHEASLPDEPTPYPLPGGEPDMTPRWTDYGSFRAYGIGLRKRRTTPPPPLLFNLDSVLNPK